MPLLVVVQMITFYVVVPTPALRLASTSHNSFKKHVKSFLFG